MTFKTPQIYKTIKSPLFISFVCFVFCVAVSELGIKQHQKNEQHQQDMYTKEISDNIQTKLLANFNETLHLNGLSAYLIATQGKVRPDELNALLASYYPAKSYDQLIINIAVAPDNQIQYIFPATKDNVKVLGLRLTDVPNEWSLLERAIQKKQPVLIGPLDLAQGIPGLIYSVPIFLADDHYWGVISIVINTDYLFNSINEEMTQLHLQAAFRGRNGSGEKGEVFWGDAKLFDGEGVLSTIQVPGGTWQLIVKSTAKQFSIILRCGSMKYN